MLFFYKLKEKLFDLKMKSQRFKKGYADIDVWSMKYWFQETLPKMIIELRDMNHGAPEEEFEEVDNFPLEWIIEQSKLLLAQKKEKGFEEEINLYNGRDKIFDRWWLVLSRIAYCLKESSEYQITEVNDYQYQFEKLLWSEQTNPNIDKTELELRKKWLDREKEIAEYKIKMKDEAFELLKKYFWNLWD